MPDLSDRLHAFELAVTGQLATLIQQTTGLKEQVGKQNGNVAKLWERANQTTERVSDLEKRIEADRAARAAAARTRDAVSGRWERWVRPVAIAAAAALLGWMLRNPRALVEAVTK